jgi:hypothetical protein
MEDFSHNLESNLVPLEQFLTTQVGRDLPIAKKGKVIPVTDRGGSHIFKTIGSQMAVRLSALRTGRPLSTGRFLVLISVRG